MKNIQTPIEPEHLTSAQAGNTEAFTSLVEPHRKPLLVHCYRMSGSLDDAEDIVQETFIRAWEKLKSFDGSGSFRNWLYVIATRLWLDEARKRKKRVLLPLEGDSSNPDIPPMPPTSPASWLDPLPESWLTSVDPSPEMIRERRESISFAFMVALQKLNARQRVVLILREVFTWSAEETAEALGLTVDSVNNLLYRARKNIEPSRNESTPAPKQHLDQFVNAWETGDVPSLIQLLHEKATFAMPPMGVWYAGRKSVQRALQNFVFLPNVKWKLIPATANGHPAFGIYRGEGKGYHAFGLLLPVFTGDVVVEVTAFLSPQLVSRFGLEMQL
ncbi:MAG TPA: RNA polymerase subunit sigma-24 [Anaerolineae bacterium]|nr:RNA polymerase subunit sigma-24 [Anaerolineae bacterium]